MLCIRVTRKKRHVVQHGERVVLDNTESAGNLKLLSQRRERQSAATREERQLASKNKRGRIAAEKRRKNMLVDIEGWQIPVPVRFGRLKSKVKEILNTK